MDLWHKFTRQRSLRRSRGVIHVGANLGQERQLYDKLGLRVLWIEPIPDVYEELVRNLVDFPNQRAINALITDQNGQNVVFHLSNNGGQSSSIFDIHLHKDIWPDVQFVSDLQLTSITLDTVLQNNNISGLDYGALIIDTQGSELLVLGGAERLLTTIDYIQTEAADFDSYRGCAVADEIVTFLSERGFKLFGKQQFASRPGGGAYFELMFKRTTN
jgi:FkbM family methyltransferase